LEILLAHIPLNVVSFHYVSYCTKTSICHTFILTLYLLPFCSEMQWSKQAGSE